MTSHIWRTKDYVIWTMTSSQWRHHATEARGNEICVFFRVRYGCEYFLEWEFWKSGFIAFLLSFLGQRGTSDEAPFSQYVTQLPLPCGGWKLMKPVFQQRRICSREHGKKATWLAGDKHWRHHQPIIFAFCLFARKKSQLENGLKLLPWGRPPLLVF